MTNNNSDVFSYFFDKNTNAVKFLFDKIINPLIIYDLENNIIFANKLSYEIIGFSKEEFINKTSDQINYLGDKLKDIIDKKDLTFTAKINSKDNTEIIFNIKAELIQKNNSSIILCQAVKIETENNLLQENFNLITKLKEKNNEIEKFLYKVSHDLKSPLITIKGFINLLEEDITKTNNENIKKDLEFIKDSTNKIFNFIDSLLELSRITRIINKNEKININLILDELISFYKVQFKEKNIEYKIQSDFPEIIGDKTKISEVFKNLILNAIKFSDNTDKPMIEIGFIDNKNFITVFVKDNGIGIESKNQINIFEAFEKVNVNNDGIGIGLTLVQEIIKHHNGKIWVESEGINKGSTFYFTINIK